MTATEEATEATKLESQLEKARQRLIVATKELHHLNGHRPGEGDCGLVDEARRRVALAEKEVDELEIAVGRAKKGISELCEKCGKPIGKERRGVLPKTTLCLTCRKKEEKRRRVYA